MHSHRSSPLRATGHSLIEVMTVITVIVVLMSLTMPSVQLVREEARKVHCLNNMHQITFSALSYAHDHGGALVLLKRTAKDKNKKDVRVSFSDDIYPYLQQEVLYKDNELQVQDALYESQSLFRCPNTETPDKKKLGSYNKQILDYGINHYGRPNGDKNVFGSSLGAAQMFDGWPHPRMSLIANPSVVYIAEAEAESSPEDIGGASRGTMQWPLRYSFEKESSVRHVVGYSAARLDGGAEWNPAMYPSNEKWFIYRR